MNKIAFLYQTYHNRFGSEQALVSSIYSALQPLIKLGRLEVDTKAIHKVNKDNYVKRLALAGYNRLYVIAPTDRELPNFREEEEQEKLGKSCKELGIELVIIPKHFINCKSVRMAYAKQMLHDYLLGCNFEQNDYYRIDGFRIKKVNMSEYDYANLSPYVREHYFTDYSVATKELKTKIESELQFLKRSIENYQERLIYLTAELGKLGGEDGR